MKKKWIGITLALLVVVVAAAAVVVLGNTKANAEEGIKISVEKTKFALNEGIEVTISGISETLQSHDLEIRLERDILPVEADHANRTEYNAYRQYFDIGLEARDGAGELIESKETMKVTFQNGGRAHPTDGGIAYIPAGVYTIWIIDFTDCKAIGNKVYVSVSELEISTEKTEFLYGEPIEVTVSGLIPEAYYGGGKWHDLEFRLENRTLDEDEGFKARVGYKQYFDIGDAAKDAAGNAVTDIKETSTWTFQDGGRYNPGGGTASIPAGAYTLWILDFTNSIVVSNKVDILVYDISISTEKTEFIQGEKIAVDFSGVDYHTTTNNKDIEIRLESGWGLNPIGFAARRGGSIAYADLSYDCTKGVLDNIYVGNAGTKVFPDDDGRYATNNSNRYTVGLGYPAGKYTLWVLDYGQAHICSNKIEITIREAAPSLELEKNTFAYGEDITVSYNEITDALMKKAGAFFELDIFKAGDVVGKQSSQAGYTMYTKNGTVDMTGGEDNLVHSGTISYPEADTDRNGKNFPLLPGDYYICIRCDNNVIGEVVNFTVLPPETVVQPELKNSIAMHYIIECGDNVPGSVSMNFTFNNEVYVVGGVLGESSKSGFVTYTFSFDNIFPQQMGDVIEAQLIVNDKVVRTYDAYSVLTYAQNKLASEKPEDIAAHDVIIAMLNYGAEAQKNFGYKTDSLVNACLSDEQKELADITGVTGVTNNLSGEAVEGYVWQAATLDLQSTLAFRFKLEAEDISKVVFTDGVNSWTFQDNSDCFKNRGNTYWFYYKNIMANQFADTYTITMLIDGVEAQSVTYSVNTYISYIGTKTDSSVTALCQALYAYGVAADAYNA